MSRKTVSIQIIALGTCLLSLDATYAQVPASQQVPGAAARLRSEYSETRRKFFDDDAAVRAPIVIRWTGELGSATAREKPIPEHGIINDRSALNRLWSKWELGVVPEVDFTNYLVLAATGGDNSAKFEVLTKLRKTGDLQCLFVPAALVKTGGPRFFVFVVPRATVRAFNGRPIPQNK